MREREIEKRKERIGYLEHTETMFSTHSVLL